MKFIATAALSAALFVGAGALSPVPPAPATTDQIAAFAAPDEAGRLIVLEQLLKTYGLPYEIQTFQSDKPGVAPGRNVVVTLGSGDKDILLTAHYDAVRMKDGTMAKGVVDNAASVVALVKAASALKGGLKNHRLRVIFFDQEELGLLGAKAYAAGPDAARVAAVVNFDVNAFGDTPFFADPEGGAAGILGGAVRKGCLAAGETCVAFDKYPPSDHLAFRKAGIPATSFSYMAARDTHQLWLFMNAGEDSGLKDGFVPDALKLIHTPRDTMEAVEPRTVERAAALAVEVARALDAGR